MCTDDQHNEKMALLKDLIEGRPPLGQIYSLSATQIYELDYKERKHIFVWPLTSYTLTLEEYGNLALTAQTWTELPFPQGLRITASGQTNSVQLFVLCTDEPIDPTSAGGGGGGGGAVTVADGADIALGSTTDGAVTTDASGTLSGKIRGLVKIFNDVWDSVGHFLLVKATQSGTWSVTSNAGTNLNTSLLALESGGNLATIAGALSSSTSTKTSVSSAASDTSLLASNASRKGALFFNDSTATLYLSYGSGAASTTSYTVQIPANGYFEIPSNAIPTVAIRGIWSAANGAVRITELT